MNSQSTGTLASPSASTILLAVHAGPGPSPKVYQKQVRKNENPPSFSPFAQKYNAPFLLFSDHVNVRCMAPFSLFVCPHALIAYQGIHVAKITIAWNQGARWALLVTNHISRIRL